MISIAELKDIATKEKLAEDKAAEAKHVRDLAMYREKIKKVHPEFIEYIQEEILSAIKRGKTKVGIYKYKIDALYASVSEYYPYEILCYMYEPDRIANTAYEIAIKEEAEAIRKELFESGIKGIEKGSRFMGEPYLYLLF